MPTQSTDIFNAGTDGLDFTADSQTWTITAGVVVSSTQQDGVVSGFKNSTLLNFGQVFSGTFTGVVFGSDDGTIVNEVGAVITGASFAVEVDGKHDMITNLGSMAGLLDGVVFSGNSHNAQLINRGSVYGHLIGVDALSFHEGGIIANFGAIRSDKVGVHVYTQPGLTTSIINAASGIISGPTDAILTEGYGAISLNNRGTIIGDINCTAPGANDVVINHGKITGAVHLGSGDDVFNGIGGKSGWIYGGDGNDTLTGGSGADHFVFDTALNAATNVDKIKNFTPSQHDKIVLSQTDFAGIGPLGPLHGAHFNINHAGPSASPQIVYTPGNGFLYYDANGHLPGGMTPFAILLNHAPVHPGDFVVIA